MSPAVGEMRKRQQIHAIYAPCHLDFLPSPYLVIRADLPAFAFPIVMILTLKRCTLGFLVGAPPPGGFSVRAAPMLMLSSMILQCFPAAIPLQPRPQGGRARAAPELPKPRHVPAFLFMPSIPIFLSLRASDQGKGLDQSLKAGHPSWSCWLFMPRPAEALGTQPGNFGCPSATSSAPSRLGVRVGACYSWASRGNEVRWNGLVFSPAVWLPLAASSLCSRPILSAWYRNFCRHGLSAEADSVGLRQTCPNLSIWIRN